MLFNKNKMFWWGVVSYCALAVIAVIAVVREFMDGAWWADEESPEGRGIVFPPLLEAKGELLHRA